MTQGTETKPRKAYYEQMEDGLLYSNLEIENELCHIIETGNIDKLTAFRKKDFGGAYWGAVADNPLRSVKNMFHTMNTLCSRAAIRGGLSPTEAFSMADTYSRQVEAAREEEKVYCLMMEAQVDYCTRVAETVRVPVQTDILQRVLDYVRKNLNSPLSTTDIAGAVGLSRSYLSRYFKRELGVNLSDYVRRMKLEESRSLLLYSDKTISQISNFLCFSSQSHYQTLFKKQYGMTPMEYRIGKGRTSL